MISNLSSRGPTTISNGNVFCFFMFKEAEPSLVLILVFEGFVDTFGHGFAMEDEAFRDRRLHTKKY